MTEDHAPPHDDETAPLDGDPPRDPPETPPQAPTEAIPPAGGPSDEPDAYQATGWHVRSRLDQASVATYAFLKNKWGILLILFALILLVGQFTLAAVILAQRPLVATLVLLSLLPALLLAWWIYRNDFHHEPLKPLLVTFLLSGVLASVAALIHAVPSRVIGSFPVIGVALFFFLIVGPVEETVKWLAIRVHAYELPTFSSALEGAVYGAAAGLGFATIENAVYIARELIVATAIGQGGLEATASTAIVRGLVGPGHVIFTAISGYYLGLSKTNPEHKGPIAVKGLIIAALAHGAYNTIVTYLPPLLGLSPLGVVSLILAYLGLIGIYLARLLRKHRLRVLWENGQPRDAGSPS